MSTIKRLHILCFLALGFLLWESVGSGMCAFQISIYETDDPNDDWMWKVARFDDHAAFERLHGKTHRIVTDIVQKNFFLLPYEVPDIVQNVFMCVWKGRHTFQGRFRRWLAGITFNEINRTLRYWRTQTRDRTRLLHYFDLIPGTGSPWLSEIPELGPSPETLAAVNELAQRVRAETDRILPTLRSEIQSALGPHLGMGTPPSIRDVDRIDAPKTTQNLIDQGILQLFERGAFDVLDLPPRLVDELIKAGQVPEEKSSALIASPAPVERRILPEPLLESLRDCARVSLATSFFEGNLIRLLLYGVPIEVATWRLSMPLWQGMKIREEFTRCLKQQATQRRYPLSSDFDWNGTFAIGDLDVITERTELRIDPQWVFDNIVNVSSRRTFGSVWTKLGKFFEATHSPVAIEAWKNRSEPEELTPEQVDELRAAKRAVEIQLVELNWLSVP